MTPLIVSTAAAALCAGCGERPPAARRGDTGRPPILCAQCSVAHRPPGPSKELAVQVGARIALRRGQLGLKQAGLARRIHATRVYVAKLEGGHVGASLVMAVRLAEVLGVTLDWLLTGLRPMVRGE